MNLGDLPTERLLELAKTRSPEALEELFRRHREPLRRMLAVRMDVRLRSRIDVSDVIQETLIEANRRIWERANDPAPGRWRKLQLRHRTHKRFPHAALS